MIRAAEILRGHLYQRGYVSGKHADALREAGFTCVANLTNQPDLVLMGALGAAGGTYLFLPMADGKKIPPQAEPLARELARRIRAGEKVLVHCRAGRNRSGLVTALTVRNLLGCSGADALAHVQERRPRALANEHFATYLRSLPCTSRT